MLRMYSTTLLLCLTSLGIASAASSRSPYARLYEQLFSDYVKAVRPVTTGLGATNIVVSPNLYSIVDVSEDEETLKFSRWFQMFWFDPYLTWDPAEFNGTEELLVDVGKIWVPDITIIEMLSNENAGTVMDFASLTYDGQVRYSLNDIISVYCSFDVDDFPYDSQNCSVSYVSWEFPANQITVNAMQSEHNNLAFFGESAEWQLINYVYENLSISDNQSISFDGVTYHIGFKRKPNFYVRSLVLPSFLITTVALFGLFSPSDSCGDRRERITIGLTACLAMSVVLMMVSSLMPKTDKHFPLLGQFMLWQMVITSVGTTIAVAVMYLQAWSCTLGHAPPEILCAFLLMSESETSASTKPPPAHQQPVSRPKQHEPQPQKPTAPEKRPRKYHSNNDAMGTYASRQSSFHSETSSSRLTLQNRSLHTPALQPPAIHNLPPNGVVASSTGAASAPTSIDRNRHQIRSEHIVSVPQQQPQQQLADDRNALCATLAVNMQPYSNRSFVYPTALALPPDCHNSIVVDDDVETVMLDQQQPSAAALLQPIADAIRGLETATRTFADYLRSKRHTQRVRKQGIRLCYRIDLLLNITFNAGNFFLLIFYFGVESLNF